VVAQLAGYTDAQIADLPAAAVVNAFGCGNPLAFSAVRPGDVVVDLGSGAGIDLLLAARKVGARGRVIGVDMTDEMIARARQNAAEAGLDNVEVRKGVIEDLPVDDAGVDWVISNCVINLSPEKHRVFAEIARVLRPGGEMLVADIVAEKLPEALTRDRRVYSACLAGAIPERAYVDGLRAAGLVDVQVRDRLVYDEEQLLGLIGAAIGEQDGCCDRGMVARQWASLLEGDVASLKVYARKPT
jgi:SAM-dependent methyltransferase